MRVFVAELEKQNGERMVVRVDEKTLAVVEEMKLAAIRSSVQCGEDDNYVLEKIEG